VLITLEGIIKTEREMLGNCREPYEYTIPYTLRSYPFLRNYLEVQPLAENIPR
jgi:hypothetical protein